MSTLEWREKTASAVITRQVLDGTESGLHFMQNLVDDTLAKLMRDCEQPNPSTLVMISEYDLRFDLYRYEWRIVDRVTTYTIDEQLQKIADWMILEAGRRFDARQAPTFIPRVWFDQIEKSEDAALLARIRSMPYPIIDRESVIFPKYVSGS
jgi:hypothetical protein